MHKERRYSKRKAAKNVFVDLQLLNPQVWFRYWNPTEYAMRDVSTIGIGVFTQEKIPVGTFMGIDLRIGKSQKNIRVFGRLEWINKLNDHYRAGISFSWWKDNQDKKMVDKFLGKLTIAN